MNKKLSIITVNYNNQIGLKQTINSVLSQNSPSDFEYIIIDGGSTDGSKELIETYADRLTYWVSEPDKGIYNAMNKAIRAAKGDYVYFLNSGDLLYDQTIVQKTEPYLDQTCGIYYGNLIYQEKDIQVPWIFPEQLSFSFFLTENINHQACFIKRALFDELFFYNEEYKIVSDWEFLIYAICKRNIPYKHIDMLIAIYDTTGISSNANNREAMNQDKNKTLQKYFPLFVQDYRNIDAIKLKRVQQFLFIKKFKPAWLALKGFMNIVLLFLPKFKKENA